MTQCDLEHSPWPEPLRCTNPLNAPESISGQILKACADQLADVLVDTLNLCLLQFVMLKCNTACIHVVPMKPRKSCLRDYHPFPLTPVNMGCLGLLLKTHIASLPPSNLDSLQFAWRKYISWGCHHLNPALPWHIWTWWRRYMWEYCWYSTAFNIILLILRDLIWALPGATESRTCWQAGHWWWRLALPPPGLSTQARASTPWSHITVLHSTAISVVTYWVFMTEERKSDFFLIIWSAIAWFSETTRAK